MAEHYDAIVIGSGLGGLTSGAMFARTGKRVLLLERNASFGGAATTYRHGAMTVEGSLHETTDPRRTADPKGTVFEALDLYDDVEFVRIPEIYEVRASTVGEPFVLPHGLEAIQAALSERFPYQGNNIKRFLRHVRRTLKAIDYAGGGHSALWRAAHAAELPLELWAVLRDYRSSLSDVFERFFGDDEAIKIALAANLHNYADDPDAFWWLGYAAGQGGLLEGGGNYIRGGSHRLSNRLVEVIRDEGGEAKSECEVFGIELDDAGRACAVRYHAGRGGPAMLAAAPVIFANAAPHVVARMLPQDARESFMAPYRDRPLSITRLYAAFGLERPPSELGVTHYTTQLIPAWVKKLSDYRLSADLLSKTPGTRMPVLAVVDYSHIDSALRRDRLYPVSVDCIDQVSNWNELGPSAYAKRKNEWLAAILIRLDREWPGFAAAVAESTIVTARSIGEYLNAPDGAIHGFALRPPREGPVTSPMQADTSIDGLWLASSYSGGGGYSGAMGGGAAASRAALKAIESV